MLEEKLMKEFSRLHLHATLVRGRPGTSDHPPTTGHITLFNHLSSHELRHHMREAGVIICRPGYSSLMDLAALGCRAVLVPTPGQTEQEYLALYHGRLGNYLVMQQASLDLAEALETIKRYSGLRVTSMGEVLRERISNFLDRI
jgi:UDP-N-acetylglucosamine:LPS N-acetylglucosamine transferase